MTSRFGGLFRGVEALAGIFLLVGFFLPWIRVGALLEVSGFELLYNDSLVVREALPGHLRTLFLIAPLAGVALITSAATGFQWHGLVAATTGFLVLAAALGVALYLFVQSTGPGVWLLLVGALMALAVGLLARHHRGPRLPASGESSDLLA